MLGEIQRNQGQVKNSECVKDMIPVLSPGLKRKGGGGGGGGGMGIEHLEAVYALDTYIATILCCVNTVKSGVLHPLGGNSVILKIG